MSSIEELSKSFTKLQNDLSDLVQTRQKLETQFQENKIVKEEFDTLDEDAKVYKLIGPVLLPQEQEEAKLNIEKRLEFINAEINRAEENIQSTQDSLQKTRSSLVEIRTAMYDAQSPATVA